MAKKKKVAEVDVKVEGQADVVVEVKAKKKFLVSLACPTPLAHPSLEVEAEDEGTAWKLFQEANNIGDSIHPLTIVEV